MRHAKRNRRRRRMSQHRNDGKGASFRNRDNGRLHGTWTRFNGAPYVLGFTFESWTEMKATIHHNPNCGTSRKTLEILKDSGVDLTVNEYLKTPPSRAELKRLYDRAGIAPRDGLRAKEPLADELGLNRANVTDDEILDAMTVHPILINRPLVETEKGARLCRPQDVVREIL